MDIFLAIIIGTLFGFVLHRVGAANPQNIIGMLRLSDLHLMKAILLGIGLASLLLFLSLSLGLLAVSHISIKSSYIGVLIGGAILGLGWAISGYCPGTGIAALGAGRKDALFFILGGLLGAFLYMISYGSIKGSILFQEIAGGKVTLAEITGSNYAALFSFNGAVIGIGIALLFIVISKVLPNSIRHLN